MTKAGIIVSILFFSISLPLAAQLRIFKTYTAEDGLVSNPVRRIFQDSRGFIWIGTWQGLSKYDGHKFTNYTTVNGLSDNMINDMYESPDGKLYVAGNGGSTDILQHDAITKKAAFRNAPINQFYITKNNRVLAATDSSGLHEIKNGNIVKPLQEFPGLSYHDLTELNDSLLIAGAEGPLSILNHQFQLIAKLKSPVELLVFKIYRDSKKRIWVGTNDGLKIVSPLQKNNLQKTPTEQALNLALLPAPIKIPILKNQHVFDMLEDSAGDFWIATTNGLIKMDTKGDCQVFSERDGLPSSNIHCLFQDKEKNIWIGTSLGLAKLVTKNNIFTYANQNGLFPNGIGFLAVPNKDIFILGTYVNPTTLYNTRTNQLTTLFSRTYLGTVFGSRPLLFFGQGNWVGKYDTVTRRITDHILPDSSQAWVNCSVIDRNGIIFNGTGFGLAISTGGRFYFENKFPLRITDIVLDKKGFLWVATWENGLFRIHYTSIKNNAGSFRINLTVEDFSHLVPEKNIRCLFEDSKGNIWVGTRNLGVVLLSNSNTKQYTVQRFDLRQGLMSNWARVIAEDAKGNIWIGSNLGIDKLISAGNSFHVFNFSRVNNYFDNINDISAAQNNSLWLATNKGLVNIIDGEMEKTPPGPVYITLVKLGDTSFNYNKNYLASGERKVRLKYYQNQAEFEFSSPGYINEKQILYSHRLHGGADTAWSKPENLQKVSYASLQPGNYRFEVRTSGWNGEWGASANFVFSIRPPYWQTWWFYSLVAVTVIFLFYAFYLYRIRQFKNLQKVRNRIASDLHDDIGSTLTNINMLSEISRKNLGQPREAEKFLQRITEEVTSTSQALNDIIWSVNSSNDSIEEIFTRMRRYAADLFDTSNTLCHLNLDKTVAEKKLNMEQRRDLYLIYKESVNNIHKHAFAKNIWIEIKWLNKKLHLKIKDDGKGFESGANTHRNGLKNIRTRTGKWKGSTTIKTSPGNGTVIEVVLPLAE